MTDVPDIVAIMKARGWTEGAALLEHWLSQPGNADPNLGIPDFSTVTIDWTLGFSRAAEIYRAALNDKVWTSEHAKGLLRSVIERRIQEPVGKSSVLRVDMPRSTDPSSIRLENRIDVYTDRVAYVPLSRAYRLDGLMAALGQFGYYFNVSGGCEPAGDGFRVYVDRVGIYIRDSYDFNDDRDWWNPATWPSQHLGYWDSRHRYVDGVMPMHCWENRHAGRLSELFGHPLPYGPELSIDLPECGTATRMTNSSFRDYRERTRAGGDFFVYSDIVYHETNDEFLV